ncbi:SH3 domain-containing protein [Chlamydiifrater phoenicopteri]|uniref:SH3 domain-containing protein n=1 Tax=Chlamydiifrater phoenicopteri TaxID=2681469 RepID=UPI001BCCA8E3|nr:SH3 domain-containing protein [Chlamydiifrater phoenicopteri]
MRQLPVLLLILGSQLVSQQSLASSNKSSGTKELLSKEFSSFTGEIKGSKVRLRHAPNVGSTIIKELSKGDKLLVVGMNSEYYMVKPPSSVTGYIFKTFVLDGVVEGEQVNVRLEPSTTAPIVTRLSRGTEIKTIPGPSSQGKWQEIALPEECVFYVAKNYINNIGSPEVYQTLEHNRKIALDLLDSAASFAFKELEKPLKSVDLESIYSKVNLVQTEEFAGIPELQKKIQEVLEKIQDRYLEKTSTEEISSSKPLPPTNSFSSHLPKAIENYMGKSLLSQHIRKQTTIKCSPQTKGRVTMENSLFSVWANMQNSSNVSLEDFYKAEQAKASTLRGTIEQYTHVVRNNPGDYLLKDQDNTLAFLYTTKFDMDAWVGKKVVVQVVPRPNNHFAFPAYFILSIREDKL